MCSRLRACAELTVCGVARSSPDVPRAHGRCDSNDPTPACAGAAQRIALSQCNAKGSTYNKATVAMLCPAISRGRTHRSFLQDTQSVGAEFRDGISPPITPHTADDIEANSTVRPHGDM